MAGQGSAGGGSAGGGLSAGGRLVMAIEHAAAELPGQQVCRLAAVLAGFPGPTGVARQAAAVVVPTAGFRCSGGRGDRCLGGGRGRRPRCRGGPGPGGGSGHRRNTAGRPERGGGLDGPSSPVIPVRSTVAVLQGIVDHARHELLVVSFAAYKVPAVVEAMAQAVARGVKVRLVLDSAIDAGGKLTHDAKAAFGALGQTVAFYEWPAESRQIPGGGIAAMHAKAAVADGRAALVTSANLTGQALAANMELGLLIQGGPIPRRVAAHFSELIATGTLRPVGG